MKNKKLKIGIISKLWETCSPFSTGGTGMSLGNLVNGLVDRGHFVTLFATGDSKTKAQKLVSVKSEPYKNDYSEIKEYQNIAQAFNLKNKFDIIHTHIEHKACFFAPLSKIPTLISIRYGEFFKDELKLLKQNKNLNYSFNSKALEKKFIFLNSKGTVYNGLDLNNYQFSNTSQDYLLFLGRVTTQKGVDLAVKIAHKLKLKLIIAGRLNKDDQKYFNKKIKPYLNTKIKFIGEIQFKEKINLLKNARALIQPTRYFEACANVILETQACGTPVITFDKGSNKEIVKNKKTGFVVHTEQEMINAIKNINKIKRQDCRNWIKTNFTLEKMISNYEKLYYEITNTK